MALSLDSNEFKQLLPDLSKLLTRGIEAALYNRDSIQAAKLARSQVELIESIIDSVIIGNPDSAKKDLDRFLILFGTLCNPATSDESVRILFQRVSTLRATL